MNKMNLQENYKRLFKGKVRSNDQSLINEAVAQPNTILVTRMDNGTTDMQFTKPEELDNDIYADALEMAEDKYSMGTKIEFIYVDEAGKSHEGELTLKGKSDYDISNMFDKDMGREVENKVVDMFDDFS